MSDKQSPDYKAIHDSLAKRMGDELFRKRIDMQRKHAHEVYNGSGLKKFHPENSDLLIDIMHAVLKLTGFNRRALKNSLDFRVEENIVPIAGLPADLREFTILQLSDIHVEGFGDHGEALSRKLAGLSCDVCVVTGDFRLLMDGNFNQCISDMKGILNSISSRCGVFAVPGNHDFIEMIPLLEAEGIRMLLNENVRVTCGDSSLVISGIDDPHFYGTDCIEKALDGVTGDDVTVLLAHTADVSEKAVELGIDLYLCGHTHGGQFCLPGGIPVMTKSKSPREFVSGAWNIAGMHGYTSRGTGCSGIPARFNCPPEITIHRLIEE